jgi:hypothetical protein
VLLAGDAGVVAPPLSDGSIGTNADYCSSSGPPVLVASAADGGVTTTCPDDLAQRAFRYALCACSSFVGGALATDAFDGTQGGYTAATSVAGGSVGVDGMLHPGQMQIGGSLWASSAGDITTTAAMVVDGDLHAEGELHPSPSLTVQGDAWMAGGVQTGGDVTVGGTLHVPASATLDVAGMRNFGAPDGTPFSVAPPCDCNLDPFVDIAGVVATYRANNDDMALGIGPHQLANVQADTTLSLPCGRIYFDTIAGQAAIHLTATGRVAIFVGGDLSTSDFTIDTLPGAEVDLFVAGSMTVSGAFQVGDPANPARGRTYVGGPTVNLQGVSTLDGNLYAPNATLTLGTAPTVVFGALFIGSLSSQSDLTIHYDTAVGTMATSSCPAPAICASCDDCNGGACVGGKCIACADSTECCAPLVCSPQHTCVAGVPPR